MWTGKFLSLISWGSAKLCNLLRAIFCSSSKNWEFFASFFFLLGDDSSLVDTFFPDHNFWTVRLTFFSLSFAQQSGKSAVIRLFSGLSQTLFTCTGQYKYSSNLEVVLTIFSSSVCCSVRVIRWKLLFSLSLSVYLFAALITQLRKNASAWKICRKYCSSLSLTFTLLLLHVIALPPLVFLAGSRYLKSFSFFYFCTGFDEDKGKNIVLFLQKSTKSNVFSLVLLRYSYCWLRDSSESSFHRCSWLIHAKL